MRIQCIREDPIRIAYGILEDSLRDTAKLRTAIHVPVAEHPTSEASQSML